ncbi:hypothetical protein BCV69DRAFT_312232 [Microstroma glucosiphilum]|uniref:F-box domain-containing protein n=1 Tax=Pseudomicrostroma glucosiphilum TaxID=1684307 RepID=A0A316U6Q0_9BASI|nr:hypothetical protein BCV69DRAFT_312232 [Pseudomicrostroma glucosiphilum]PWN20947.1 hypothetical protein BCV69DRAFT_312232 [Pseudomicrostroma glucosiphilum]
MAPKSFNLLWTTSSPKSASANSLPSTSAASPPTSTFTSPPSPAGVYLADLPVELQFLVLSHLPIRSLSKGLARTSHHWAGTIDEHLRREVQRLIGGPQPPGGCTLVFEAQRPIDTLTHKHRLYFSHFGVTNSTGGAYSTTANFSFLPIEEPSEAPSHSRERSNGGDGAGDGESRPAVLRNLPHHLAGRVREEHCTSSVTLDEPGSSRGRDTQPGSSRGSGAATPVAVAAPPLDAIHHPLDAYDWAGPVSSYVNSPPTSQSRSRPDVTRAERRRKISKPTYRMQLDPLDSFETWILTLAVRVSSSAPLANRSKTAFDRFGEKHRISFETSADGPTQAASIGPAGLEMSRAMRWERRVAEGLDRVYRDWFHRPEAGEIPIPARTKKSKGSDTGNASQSVTSSVTPELISTFGAVNEALGLDREGMQDEEEGDTEAYPHPTPTPRRRLLEFDNSSCVLHLQPHACSSPQLLNLHPTLAYFYTPPVAAEAAPSSSYPPGSSSAVPLLNPSSSAPSSTSGSGAGASASLGNLSGYQYDSTSRYHALHSRLQASHRVELTWHAESIEVNAGRLLSVLEDVETERLSWERRNGARGSDQERDAWGRVYKRESVGKAVTAAAAATSGGGGGGDDRHASSILAGVDGSRQRWRGLEDEELGVEVESRGTIPLWFGNGTLGTYFTGG